MRLKQLDCCTHCGQEIPKKAYALSWCKPVVCIGIDQNVSEIHRVILFGTFETNSVQFRNKLSRLFNADKKSISVQTDTS